MEMNQIDTIPEVEWITCTRGLPERGKFVWVVIGRAIESGSARRYIREVAMGIYQGPGFQIFPYITPVCSTDVWAWAKMVPPAPPICRTHATEYGPLDEDENSEDDD